MTVSATKHARTPEQIGAGQRADATKDLAAVKAKLPAVTNGGTAVALPDNRTPIQQYLDEIAPASIVGRMIKFGKEGRFVTADDDIAIGEDVLFVALTDQTLTGWTRFHGEGQPPDRIMGLLYEGFAMPPRNTLGDADASKWDIGLDGKPQDPWQHQVYLVLQRADTTGELFTYVTSSITGRRAIGNLLRHCERTSNRGGGADYPIVRLAVGGFQHRDDRVGWVKTPLIAVMGRAPKDSAATPTKSPQADFNDTIPY